MSKPSGLTAIIESITEKEIFIRVQGRVITCPRNLIPMDKQVGEEIILKVSDPEKTSKDETVHYQTMKKLLKELVE